MRDGIARFVERAIDTAEDFDRRPGGRPQIDDDETVARRIDTSSLRA